MACADFRSRRKSEPNPNADIISIKTIALVYLFGRSPYRQRRAAGSSPPADSRGNLDRRKTALPVACVGDFDPLSRLRERVGARGVECRKALKEGPHPALRATPSEREAFAESRKREKGIPASKSPTHTTSAPSWRPRMAGGRDKNPGGWAFPPSAGSPRRARRPQRRHAPWQGYRRRRNRPRRR